MVKTVCFVALFKGGIFFVRLFAFHFILEIAITSPSFTGLAAFPFFHDLFLKCKSSVPDLCFLHPVKHSLICLPSIYLHQQHSHQLFTERFSMAWAQIED